MEQNFKLRLLSYSVIAYMLLAFAWWSVLLFIKNRDAYEAKRDLQKIMLVAEGRVSTEQEFSNSSVYQDLTKEYKTQEWMIMGEAFFFIFSLVIGVYLINRGYNREMMAARQRRNFLLSITHELKSPLASIRLVLETTLKRNLTKAQSDKLHKAAIKETDRLHTLVNDLLLSARLESAYILNPEWIDIKDLIEELGTKVKMEHQQLQLTIESKVDDTTVMGDRTGLTSVLLNLMENAVKYSGSEKMLDINLENSKNHLLIKIADQGIGIDDKEKKLIFQQFYRVGSEDTRKTKGTGLGLYIVSRIIKAHKGTIEVFDNEPKGAVFVIRLPIEQTVGKNMSANSELSAAATV